MAADPTRWVLASLLLAGCLKDNPAFFEGLTTGEDETTGPCVDDMFEDDDEEATARELGSVGVEDQDSWSGVAAPEDADWQRLRVNTDGAGRVARFGVDGEVQLCVYIECVSNVVAEHECGAAADRSTSAEGKPGCCGSLIELTHACTGVDENIVAFVEVRSTTACAPYTVQFGA